MHRFNDLSLEPPEFEPTKILTEQGDYRKSTWPKYYLRATKKSVGHMVEYEYYARTRFRKYNWNEMKWVLVPVVFKYHQHMDEMVLRHISEGGYVARFIGEAFQAFIIAVYKHQMLWQFPEDPHAYVDAHNLPLTVQEEDEFNQMEEEDRIRKEFTLNP